MDRDCAHNRSLIEIKSKIAPDVPLHGHGPGVDLEDVGAPLEVGQPELDLPVEAAGPEEGGVEGVGAVGGHQHLDVATGVEAVELQWAVRKTFH